MHTLPSWGHRAWVVHLAPVAGLALLACLAAAGCARTPAGDPRGALSVSVQSAHARALLPEGDFAPASYRVEGVGPGGATFAVDLVSASAVVQDLAVGTWAVSATALNAAGDAVAAGQGSADVISGQTADLAIALGPLAGTGGVEITVLWGAACAAAPRIEGELVSGSGGTLSVPFTVSEPGRGSGAAAEVPAGWHSLLLRLYDGTTLVAGAAEAVLVRASAVTLGSVDLGAGMAGTPGSLSVSLTTSTPAARALLLAGQLAAVGPGVAMALGTSAPATWSQTWYLDGIAAGSGQGVELSVPTAPGSHRLDAVALDPASPEAGSASCAFVVTPDPARGVLTPNFVLNESEGLVQGIRGARSVAVSWDGAAAWVTGYDSDSVAVFARSATSGLLTYAGKVTNGSGGVEGLDGADGLCLSPDGRHLYVAGYTSDTVAAFSLGSGGSLSFVGSVLGLDGARALATSPDGAFVYAAVYTANAVAVLARNAATGALTLASSVANGTGGVTLLEGPTDIVVSPDGAHVYVTSYTSDAVVWFARDPATGALTPGGAVKDGEVGVEGLNGAHGLAVSPDGTAVLAASYYDKALAVFSRDAASGALSFHGALVDGVAGVEGMLYARDVAVSPGGETVYVSGGGDDAVAVFRRVPATGVVSFLGAAAVPDGPRGIALSPDGLSLYACASTAGALAALRASP